MRSLAEIDPMLIRPMIPEPWQELYSKVEDNEQDDRKKLIEQLSTTVRDKDAYRDELLEMRETHASFQHTTRIQMTALTDEMENLRSRLGLTHIKKTDKHDKHEKHCDAARRVPLGGKNCTCWRPRAERAEAAISDLLGALRRVKQIWNMGTALNLPTIQEINRVISSADPTGNYMKGLDQAQ